MKSQSETAEMFTVLRAVLPQILNRSFTVRGRSISLDLGSRFTGKELFSFASNNQKLMSRYGPTAAAGKNQQEPATTVCFAEAESGRLCCTGGSLKNISSDIFAVPNMEP